MHKLITAPIYYVNGAPHIGHLYTSIAVDVLARFEKLNNRPVFTSFGTDEHGQKVESAAHQNNQSPIDFADVMHKPFKEMLELYNIEYNSFIRTTNDAHKATATYLWNQILESGLIYEGKYAGWYSKVDEAYYKEADVADGKSIETGSAVEWVEEACLFFRLSAMKEKLLKHYQDNPNAIKPKTKYSEVMGLLKADLPDLAISRSRFAWGIPVPNEPTQVMYVWIDALANYLTAIRYPYNTDYTTWWDQSIHIIGKDILKFHAIYWPAFLMAAKLAPPSRIFAHGWWSVDGQKMSKSLGNVISPLDLLKSQEADCIRYFLFREVNFGNDGTFSNSALVNIINTELANELGNLVQRVLVLCYNKYGRTMKCADYKVDILMKWDNALNVASSSILDQDITGYLNAAREAIIATNQYIDTTKPWKCNEEDAQKILGVLCACVQRLALLYYPIIPTKSKQVMFMLGINNATLDYWSSNYSYPLAKPVPIFAKINLAD